MKSLSRWIIPGILIILSILLFNRGLDLWSINVDGEGIGVHFLLFEINDRVPVDSISSYAIGFFISSLVAFIMSVVVIGINLKSKYKAS